MRMHMLLCMTEKMARLSCSTRARLQRGFYKFDRRTGVGDKTELESPGECAGFAMAPERSGAGLIKYYLSGYTTSPQRTYGDYTGVNVQSGGRGRRHWGQIF